MHNGTLHQNEDWYEYMYVEEEENGDKDSVYVVRGEYTSPTGSPQN